jgi:hypothetical protein
MEVCMGIIEPRELISRMSDQQDGQFLCKSWRKQSFVAAGCVPEFNRYYSGAEFLHDYQRLDHHKATFLISIAEHGQRHIVVPRNWATVESALNQGVSMAFLALHVPTDLLHCQTRWYSFLPFYRSLLDYLCPDFPSPARGQHNYYAIASVDFFYTSPNSKEVSIGGHYDTGDVFYFVLEGEKEWTVELSPDPITTKTLLALPGGMRNLTDSDRPPVGKCMKVTLVPGDCLYVPPYTYHRVRSRGASLAVSLGLPTFNETSLLSYFLNRIQIDNTLYDPLPTFPIACADLHRKASQETCDRVMRILNELISKFGGSPEAPFFAHHSQCEQQNHAAVPISIRDSM